MMELPESAKKANISWGLVAFMVVATFWFTTFYHTTTTMENRMDKRHQRTNELLLELDERLKEVEKPCE